MELLPMYLVYQITLHLFKNPCFCKVRESYAFKGQSLQGLGEVV